MTLPRLAVGVIGLLLLAGSTVPALSQDYPSRAVTIVNPFAPGGGTDLLARMVAGKLEQRFGKSFVVENKTGAGSIIAAVAVQKAAPDGYTLLMAPTPTMAVNVALYKSLPYDPLNDFIPIALLGQTPFVLVVNPELPVKSVPELVAYAKANPSKMSFASVGPGVPHHLYMEMFKHQTGIQASHVPYRGSLPALNDVVAGHVPMMFVDFGPATGALQSGKVRPLGVSSTFRVAGFENVPPLAEAGVPGYESTIWLGIMAPKGTPQPVIDKLNAEINKAINKPDILAAWEKQGAVPMVMKPAEFDAYLRKDIEKWAKVVKEAKLATP